MPLDSEILKILVCPETKQALVLAQPDLVERVNKNISQGVAKTAGGGLVKEAIDAGLLRADNKVLYPIRSDIPIMLSSEAILLEGN